MKKAQFKALIILISIYCFSNVIGGFVALLTESVDIGKTNIHFEHPTATVLIHAFILLIHIAILIFSISFFVKDTYPKNKIRLIVLILLGVMLYNGTYLTYIGKLIG